MARPKRICSIPDCGKVHSAHGYCADHYNRWKRYGDPTAGRIQRGAALRYYQDIALTYDGDECLIWPFSTNNGYGQLRYNGRPALVSRLVCEATHGPSPAGWHAAHSCGNGDKGCVAKRHLSWKSPADNEADKRLHGTYYARRGGAKLTVDDVRRIRDLRGASTNAAIAKQFGVTSKTVRLIRQNRTWLEGSI